MAETKTAPVASYGYASDEVKVSPFNFGLNAGVTKLTKFEWIPNAGKDGAEQEALDIVFNINGTDKNYRMFPVVKAFGKNQEEITDPAAPEMQDAIIDFNARVTHILHAFLDSEAIKAGLARPIANFKEFCEICMGLLPKNYSEIVLDVFLQYQWQIGSNNDRTYLELPKKMKYGRWLIPAVAPVGGAWIKHAVENPTDDVKKALYYTDAEGNEHPFFRNGWFMSNAFANQQTSGDAESSTIAATATAADGEKKATTW
jgi:hypothetical protein